MEEISERSTAHKFKRRKFSILIIVVQLFILIMYGLFVRPEPHQQGTLNVAYYPSFQDINVMMLIGFGFLMTFIKHHAFSALSYTFFINAVVIQMYILLSNFWHKVFHGDWENIYILINEKTFTAASYSVAAQLIAFGGLLGKVGPFELLVMAVIGTVGYTLNEYIVYQLLHTFDAGGSTAIHTFGAYFGLTVSRILSCKIHLTQPPKGSYINSTLSVIGTFFLWMFWPSFNAGYFPESPFQKTLIIGNTILSLTGSCLGTFLTSAALREKFSMEDILNASLAGGVIIGAVSGVAINPAASLTIGFIGGIISSLGYIKLSTFLYDKIGLHDTCGINNLHGIPGLLGGILSAIVIAAYQSSPLPPQYANVVSFFPNPVEGRDFSGQAGIQIAATFISFGIGIAFGGIVGIILYIFYNFKNEQFYDDSHYFEVEKQEQKSFEKYDKYGSMDKLNNSAPELPNN